MATKNGYNDHNDRDSVVGWFIDEVDIDMTLRNPAPVQNSVTPVGGSNIIGMSSNDTQSPNYPFGPIFDENQETYGQLIGQVSDGSIDKSIKLVSTLR